MELHKRTITNVGELRDYLESYSRTTPIDRMEVALQDADTVGHLHFHTIGAAGNVVDAWWSGKLEEVRDNAMEFMQRNEPMGSSHVYRVLNDFLAALDAPTDAGSNGVDMFSSRG